MRLICAPALIETPGGGSLNEMTSAVAFGRRLSGAFAPRLLAILALGLAVQTAFGDLAIETDTARVLEPGHFEFGAAGEFQTSPNGSEYALPLAVEFGVFHHLEVLIEPVPFTSIHPKASERATGMGDLETTLTYLIVEEKKYVPAFALAGEVKIPTARNSQIGTGEYDYRIYAIASKRLGNVDLHMNLGYNITGSPPGVKTRNPFDVAIAAEWFVHPRFDLFTEVTYVSSSSRSAAVEGTLPDVAIAAGGGPPEIAGSELVGSVGIRAHVNRHLDVFGSFSYDNNDAKLFRTGFAVKF
jgi:hypothetical protein